MNRKQSKSSYLDENLNVAANVKAETYTAPDIEIIDIQLEQNILQSGSGDIPGMPGEPW